MRHWSGSIYWASEECETEHHFISNFDVEAKNRRDAIKLVLDAHWDDRLDSASCHPIIKWAKLEALQMSYAEALAVSDLLELIFSICCRCLTPIPLLEHNPGTGSVILSLRQVVEFLRRAGVEVPAKVAAI